MDKEEWDVRVGDVVIDRGGRIGVVEAIRDTGQIFVRQFSVANVWCTYDHSWMLKLFD